MARMFDLKMISEDVTNRGNKLIELHKKMYGT